MQDQANGNGQPPVPENPYRCEIKDNAKGDVQISVRATGTDEEEALKVVAVARAMYEAARG